MYTLGWILLVTVSLALSLAAFAWGLATGQFADQGRARYLALGDEAPAAAAPPAKRRPESYALAAIAALGGLALAAPVVLSLLAIGAK